MKIYEILLWSILIAAHCCLSVDDNPSNFFIAKPGNVTVQEGNDVLLACKFQNGVPPCFWSRNGAQFVPNGNGYRYVSATECSIMIMKADVAHDAFYRCGDFSDYYSGPPAKVTVLVRPEYPEIQCKENCFTIDMNLFVPTKEQNVTLNCLVRNGNPVATVKWFVDTLELPSHNEIMMNTNGVSRTIKSEITLNPKDRYLQHKQMRCVATHPLFNSSKNVVSAQIKIIIPGVIINTSATFIANATEHVMVAAVGSYVDLKCDSLGDVMPEYIWEKRNKDNPKWEIFDNKNTAAIIAEDCYIRCGAKPKNDDVNYVYSNALKISLDQSHTLAIIEHPRDAIVNPMQDIILHCIFSRPPYRCDWLRDGYPFIPDGIKYIFIGNKETNDCSILIKSSFGNLDATYACESPGTGETHGIRSKLAKVSIKNMPKDPEIWYEERSLETGAILQVKYGSSAISIDCQVKDGNPAARIEWFVTETRHNGYDKIKVSSKNKYWVSTINTLNLTITPDMEHQRIICRSIHDAYIAGNAETYTIIKFQSPTTRIQAYIPGFNTETPIIVGPEVTVTMFCKANGDPDPYYEWKFHEPNSSIWTLSANGQNISVKNKPGIYTCTAWNDLNISHDFVISNEILLEVIDPHEVNLGALVGIAAACIFVIGVTFGAIMYTFSQQKLCFKKETAL